MNLRAAAVLVGALVALAFSACSDGGDGSGSATRAPTVPPADILAALADDERECPACAPNIGMRVGDAVLLGKAGNISFRKGNHGGFLDAFTFVTPTFAVDAPIDEDAMIVLPGDYAGTLNSVLVFEVVPAPERQPTDSCMAEATPRGRWATCTGAIKMAGRYEFDEPPAPQVSSDLGLPLSELVSEPGEYVVVLNAAIGNGEELWDGEFGFYLDAVES